MDIVYYVDDTDKTHLKKIYIKNIDFVKDIVKNILTINIPNKINRQCIKTIGCTDGEPLINLPLFYYNYIKDNNINICIKIKGEPIILNDLSFTYGRDIPVLLEIPASVEQIRFNCFKNFIFKHFIFKGNNLKEISSFCFNQCSFEEPFILPQSCTVICQYAFGNANFKKGFIIPDDSNLEKICTRAFFKTCFNSNFIKIPIETKIIEERAFCFSHNINEIIFSENSKINHIDEYSFEESSIKKVIIKSRNEINIREGCFSDCFDLESIDLFESKISVIPEHFCLNNHQLTNIVLPKDLKLIEKEAFLDCHINSVLLPSSLEKICPRAFQRNAIKTIAFKDGISNLKYIGAEAFANNNIETIPSNILKNVIYCGMKAFSNNKFKELKLEPAANEKALKDSLFESNYQLTSVELVNTENNCWTCIYHAMFFDCYNLSMLIVPKTITTIMDYGLYSTAIREIKLDNVESIGSYAFKNCKHLKTCDFSKSHLKTIRREAFKNTPALKAIKLPLFISSLNLDALNGVPNDIINDILSGSPFINIK